MSVTDSTTPSELVTKAKVITAREMQVYAERTRASQAATDRARKVIMYGKQEAQRLGHDFLGTEHILLGLVKEGTGVAANVLKALGVGKGDRVVIYANATVLGGDTSIGADTVIGGNVFLTSSVPPGSLVFQTADYRVRRHDDGFDDIDFVI